jgi:S1 RNA binding domain protein
MDLEIGSILTGKVTGITKFGAFVTVAPGKSGLVHISEISNTYVNDIHDHLTENQEVKVKVIGIDQNGRVNLSIKAVSPTQARPVQNGNSMRNTPPRGRSCFSPRSQNSFTPRAQSSATVDLSFEDKLKRFMQDSDSKISGIRQYSDHRTSRRRGNR